MAQMSQWKLKKERHRLYKLFKIGLIDENQYWYKLEKLKSP